jgi:hypothetical protein
MRRLAETLPGMKPDEIDPPATRELALELREEGHPHGIG